MTLITPPEATEDDSVPIPSLAAIERASDVARRMFQPSRQSSLMGFIARFTADDGSRRMRSRSCSALMVSNVESHVGSWFGSKEVFRSKMTCLRACSHLTSYWSIWERSRTTVSSISVRQSVKPRLPS